MRDLRDPQAIGELLTELRRDLPTLAAHDRAECLEDYDVPDYAKNPSCIDKYGRPGELEPVFMEVRVK